MLATWHYHIELSSICPIKCPKCPRQEVPETLVQTQWTYDFFIEHFTADVLQSIQQFSFCGDDGDPIYCKDFIKIVQYIKQAKPELRLLIVTNGSYKSKQWWGDLAGVLNKYDCVHFSLDGWDQESNEKYRVNSDWKSIIHGVAELRKNIDVKIVWAAIAFSFNEEHLSAMMLQAGNLFFDEFQVTKSTKFEDNDPLAPSDLMISQSGRFERMNIKLQEDTRDLLEMDNALECFARTKQYNGITPLCHVGTKGLYLTATGKFLPCCWMGNRYSHIDWDQDFDLHKRSLTDILEDDFWENEFLEFKYSECKSKCKTSEVTLDTIKKW